jgi:hypothetical protein
LVPAEAEGTGPRCVLLLLLLLVAAGTVFFEAVPAGLFDLKRWEGAGTMLFATPPCGAVAPAPTAEEAAVLLVAEVMLLEASAGLTSAGLGAAALL